MVNKNEGEPRSLIQPETRLETPDELLRRLSEPVSEEELARRRALHEEREKLIAGWPTLSREITTGMIGNERRKKSRRRMGR